jgi:hypothetical protein
MARTFPNTPTESRSFQQTYTSHDWHVQPFVKDQLAFRLSGAPSVRPNSLRRFVRPRNFLKLSASDTAVNPLRSQDFHLISTARGASIQITTGELFAARLETLSRSKIAKKAHKETEDDSKMKDRLEVLLCAETLQGTLSPNANPGKSLGLNWRSYDIGCHEPLRGFSKQLRHSVSLVLDSIFYTRTPSDVQAENQKSYLKCTVLFRRAVFPLKFGRFAL